jgi:putative endopeptidase
MKRLIPAAPLLLLLSCAGGTSPVSQPVIAPGGYDAADLDRNVAACDDFYQFASGGWLKANPLRGSFSAWGQFQALGEKNREAMHAILDDLVVRPRASLENADDRKIATLYASCMDEAGRERAGIAPLRPLLDRIDALSSRADLTPTAAELRAAGLHLPFDFSSEPDPKKSTDVIASIGQAGLGLPERDYYLRDDERSRMIRDEYRKHIAAMLRLAGDSGAEASAETILAFETELARASSTVTQLRDAEANYHPMPLPELAALTPHVDWPAYVATLQVPAFERVDVGQPEFLRTVDRLFAEAPLETWKRYFRWQAINAFATSLPAAFEDEDFRFNDTVLEGKTEQLPRWRRCVAVVDQLLGDALGRRYVEKHFPPAAKQRVDTMIDNLIGALHSDIETVAWMSEPTRRQALAKLGAFRRKIGYPERWKDYSTVNVVDGPLAANALEASRFLVRENLGRIGKPLDRNRWAFTPPTVNAYNSVSLHEIVFPAGILQPPMFDPAADDAYNYGGIGAVIGHELIHGFDDQGRKFDAHGNLTDWWTADDKRKFEELASCVEEQFNGYEVAGGVKTNGKLVLGESLADLGGLKIAYAAYLRSTAGKPRQIIDGFTPEQRFFLGWARIWATNFTPEFERLLATTDAHPVSRFRVNGPLSNMPEFASAFGCRTSQALVRDQRCAIW